MKKWIALFVLGGTFPLLPLSEAAPGASEAAASSGPGAAPTTAPCPSCCPPEICTYNGPSFDGTTQPSTMEHSRQ